MAIFTRVTAGVGKPARPEGRRGAARAQTPTSFQGQGDRIRDGDRAAVSNPGTRQDDSVNGSSCHAPRNQERWVTEPLLFSNYDLVIFPVSEQHEGRWAGRQGSLLCLLVVQLKVVTDESLHNPTILKKKKKNT